MTGPLDLPFWTFPSLVCRWSIDYLGCPMWDCSGLLIINWGGNCARTLFIKLGIDYE